MPQIRKNKGFQCLVLGCKNPAASRGLCAAHARAEERAKAKGEEVKEVETMNADPEIRSLYEIAKAELRKPMNTRMADWALEHIVLPPSEGVGGDSRLSWECYGHVPWILDQIQNPKCEEFVLCCSSQFGKSVVLFTLAGYWGGEKGWSGLYALPTETLQKSVPKNRLGRTLSRSNIGYQGIVKTDLQFAGGNYIRIGLMSSPSTLAEMPAKFVIGDEIDENVKWETDPIKLMQNRLTTALNKKTILASTPKLLDDNGIFARYNTTKRHVIESKCPHCDHWWHIKFEEHFRWPDKVTADDVKSKRLGWVECPSCQGRINDTHHAEIVKYGQRVVCIDEDRSGLRIGLQGRKWETIWANYSTVVAEYLDSENDVTKLKDFWNSWCAEPREVENRAQMVDHRKNVGLYKTENKEIPEWVQYVTAGIDVDDKAVWVLLFGWGERNRVAPFHNARIPIDGKGQGPLVDALQKVRDVVNTQPFKFLGEGKFQRPEFIRGCIDCGYQTTVIYDFCRENPIWLPVKGGSPSRLYEMKQADPRMEHKGKYRGLHYYLHDTHQVQEILHGRFLSEPNSPGGIEFAQDQPKRLYDHLQAVKRVETMLRGRLVIQWHKKSNKSQDHLRDAMGNAEIAGRMLGLNELKPQEPIELIREAETKRAEAIKARQSPSAWGGEESDRL